jgi:hypothetical protein
MRPINALALLVAMLAGGCANKTDYREKEPWTSELWNHSVQVDNERATSETQRAQAGWHLTTKLTTAIWDQIQRVYYWISGNSPFDAAKNLLDPTFPDRRRKAIVYLAKREWGREPPYTTYYVEMSKTDAEPLVRSMALRALNRARADKQTAQYIKSLEDTSERVRLEAAKALANMPDEKAMEPLINHLKAPQEDVDVRIACADALRQYKNLQSAQALIGMLRERNFGIAWQSRWTLKLMTGQDYGYEPAAWLQYLGSKEKPFG